MYVAVRRTENELEDQSCLSVLVLLISYRADS